MTSKVPSSLQSGFALAGIIALGLAAPASAATVVFGSPAPTRIGDCTPGCTPSFQTVYRGTAFGTDPVSISAISYFLIDSGSNTSNYTITLSTSANPVESLSSTFAANVGADAAIFYSGVPAVPGIEGWFAFNGTPFVYDPTAGDLLVDIQTDGENNIYSSYNGSGADAARLFSFSVSGVNGRGTGPGYHIATQFTVSSAAVPEPAAWTLMLVGFGMVGTAVRNRSRQTVRAAIA